MQHLHRKLDQILAELADIKSRLDRQGAQLMSVLDDVLQAQTDLEVKVAAENTIIGSAITLIKGLGQQVKDLAAQLAVAGTDPAKLADLLVRMNATGAAVDNSAAALAAAVPQNTPAAP